MAIVWHERTSNLALNSLQSNHPNILHTDLSTNQLLQT